MLIAQLNRFETDLSKVLLTKWLIWIRFFDFDVRHVLETKHTTMNELSRKSSSANDLEEAEKKKKLMIE